MAEEATGITRFNQFFSDEVVEESNATNPPAEGGQGNPNPTPEPTPEPDPANPTPDPANPEPPAGADEPQDLFSQLNQDFGFEFEGEFKEDYDGIKDYVGKASEELSKRNLEELFRQFPAMAEMFDFVMQGGTEEQYFNLRKETVDFSSLEIKDTDEVTQERILRIKLSEEGYDEAEINAKIDAYKSAVILKDEAKSALKLLVKKQAQKKNDELSYIQKEAEENERKYREFVQSTQSVISKGTLMNIQIPEKDKKAFVEFIFQPIDKSGRSARDIAREKMTLEERLELEYLVFKGMKVDNLILSKKQTTSLSHLRKNADKETAQASRSGQSAQRLNTSGIPAGMTINDLI